MKLRARKFLVVVAAAATALAGAFLALARPRALPPRPNPNGYDDLVAAANTIASGPELAADLRPESLRDLVGAQAGPLQRLRLGLARRCSVPTEAAITNSLAANSDLIVLKRAANLLAAEGRLAESNGHAGDAARSYAECILLGDRISHGGLIINRLVGIACETMGLSRLRKLLPKLDPGQVRQLVVELDRVEADRVQWAEIRRNESAFVRYQWRHSNPVTWLKEWLEARAVTKHSEGTHGKSVARLRLFLAELALRCYRAEHGSAAPGLEQLQPQYLQRVPADPFSGRQLIYRPQGTNWLLYSVGPDRVDDGGKPVGIGFGSKGDLFYDSPW